MFYTLIISKKQKLIAAALLLVLAGGLGLYALRGGTRYCTNEDLAGGADGDIAAELPCHPALRPTAAAPQKVALSHFRRRPQQDDGARCWTP